MEIRAREAHDKGEQPRRIQRWVPYPRISSHLKKAVLVAEDSAFWTHGGVDFQQIKESMEVNFERMEFARGASTITQQLAKNLYLSPSKNPVRKIRELLIARRLEAELTKQRILELYLNVIEWGDGIYGADAAARAYFRTPAADLDAGGIGAPRRGDHQSTRARSWSSFAAAAASPTADPAAHGRRHAAAGRHGRADRNSCTRAGAGSARLTTAGNRRARGVAGTDRADRKATRHEAAWRWSRIALTAVRIRDCPNGALTIL